jgi:hypothetical protein
MHAGAPPEKQAGDRIGKIPAIQLPTAYETNHISIR